MSKSSKTNSNSTTNTNQTLTTTPTNPQFVTDSVTGMQGHINNLLNTDPQSFVAGPSQLQSQAFAASQGIGGWQPSMGTAAGAATGLLGSTVDPSRANATSATSGNLLGVDLGAYENPNLQAVVNSTLSDADQNAAIVRAQQAAAMARDQKFSGSGSALTAALTEGQLQRARTAADANLRSNAYDSAVAAATGDLNRSAATSEFNAGQANNTSQFNAEQANSLATSDLARRLSAAGLLGDLSNSTASNDRADLGTLNDLGTQQRLIATQQAAAPLSVASIIAALNSQQPYGLFHGQVGTDVGTSSTNGTSKTTTSDPVGTLGSLLQAAGSAASGFAMLSDKRLKTDIETVGKDKAGRRVVSYRYKGEPEHVNRIGYLAQEIEKTDPDAVHTLPGGYKAVDYGLLSQRAA